MTFDTRKVESLGYRMVKKMPKSSTAWVGCTNVTDNRRQTELRRQVAIVNASSRPLKTTTQVLINSDWNPNRIAFFVLQLYSYICAIFVNSLLTTVTVAWWEWWWWWVFSWPVQRRHSAEGAPRCNGCCRLRRRRVVASGGHFSIHVLCRHPVFPIRYPDLSSEIWIVDLRWMETRCKLSQWCWSCGKYIDKLCPFCLEFQNGETFKDSMPGWLTGHL